MESFCSSGKCSIREVIKLMNSTSFAFSKCQICNLHNTDQKWRLNRTLCLANRYYPDVGL